MILLKLGGSLIAPKHSNQLNYDYLNLFSSLIENDFGHLNFVLVHGTGFVGHGWVNQIKALYPDLNLYEAIKKDSFRGRKILDDFFSQVDNFFPSFKRLKYFETDKILKEHKYILGGDFDNGGNIVSSDDIMFDLASKYEFDKIIFLTDVDGVLDENGKVIPKISLKDFENIKFWSKNNDVTGAMKSKIEKILKLKKKVIIANGFNLKNFENILLDKDFIGTVINSKL